MNQQLANYTPALESLSAWSLDQAKKSDYNVDMSTAHIANFHFYISKLVGYFTMAND